MPREHRRPRSLCAAAVAALLLMILRHLQDTKSQSDVRFSGEITPGECRPCAWRTVRACSWAVGCARMKPLPAASERLPAPPGGMLCPQAGRRKKKKGSRCSRAWLEFLSGCAHLQIFWVLMRVYGYCTKQVSTYKDQFLSEITTRSNPDTQNA